jgi:hypothetical protein
VALEAIIDRIIHGSIAISLKGESYRKTRAKNLPLYKSKNKKTLLPSQTLFSLRPTGGTTT